VGRAGLNRRARPGGAPPGDRALAARLIEPDGFDARIRALHRRTERDGMFSYTRQRPRAIVRRRAASCELRAASCELQGKQRDAGADGQV
jgi:hypothetical protein